MKTPVYGAILLLAFFTDYAFAWQERVTIDRMTDKKTRFFEQKAFVSRYHSYLGVMCESVGEKRKAIMFISRPRRVGFKEVKIRFRFDKDEAIARTVSLTSDGTVLWISPQSSDPTDPIVTKSLQSKRLMVELQTYEGPELIEFNLKGTAEAVQRLGCDK